VCYCLRQRTGRLLRLAIVRSSSPDLQVESIVVHHGGFRSERGQRHRSRLPFQSMDNMLYWYLQLRVHQFLVSFSSRNSQVVSMFALEKIVTQHYLLQSVNTLRLFDATI